MAIPYQITAPNYRRQNDQLIRKYVSADMMRISFVVAIFLALVFTLSNEESELSSILGVTAKSKNEKKDTGPLLYYNWKTNEDELYQLRSDSSRTVTVTIDEVEYPENGPVIATLVSNNNYDVGDLCQLLQTLAFINGDKNKYVTPVLVFNEGNLLPYHVNLLTSCTHRPIAFPTVDFSIFPDGFDPVYEMPGYVVTGRPKWGYYQAIKFWVSDVWHHPALEPYGTLMRVDSDSCFKSRNRYLPNFQKDFIAYHSQYMGMETNRAYVEGLFALTVQYLQEKGKHSNNQMFWNLAEESWKTYGTLPHFKTNFEMIRKGFMQRGDVTDYINFLINREPFGLYRFRWNDSVIRFMTVALFATSEMIMIETPEGFGHREECDKRQIEEGLKLLASENMALALTKNATKNETVTN